MLDILARLVLARPRLVLLVATGVVLVVGSAASRSVQASGNEAFAPDTPELEALESEAALFAASDDVAVQLVLGGDPGDDVVSPEGLADVRLLTEAVRQGVAPDLLADPASGPPVQSWFSGVERALEQAGRPGAVPSAAALDMMVAAGVQSLPPSVAAQVARLTSGEDPTEATTGIVLVRLDRAVLTAGTADLAGAREAIVAGQQQVLDAIVGVPTTFTARGFAAELLQTPDPGFRAEVARLFGIAFGVIALVLLLVFRLARNGGRSLAAAVRRAGADTGLAMLVAVLAIVFQQGAGVLLGPDGAGLIGYFSPPTQIVPILLVALGVDYVIHLQERYRDGLAVLGPDESTRQTILGVGPALALAAITTAIGFLTNLLSPTPAIRDLGTLAAVGLVAAFLLAVTAYPASRLLLDRRALRRGTLATPIDVEAGGDVLATLGRAFATPALRRPVAMLVVAGLLSVAGAVGLSQLRTAYDFTDFVPEDSPLLAALSTLQRDFGGGVEERTSILVRGDGIAEPAVHNAMLAAEARLAGVQDVATVDGAPVVRSFATVLEPLLLAPSGGPSDTGAGQAPGAGEAAAAIAQARAAGLRPDLTIAESGDVEAVYAALAAVVPRLAAVAAFGDDGSIEALRLQVSTPVTDADVQVPRLRADLGGLAADVAAAGDVTAEVSSQAIVQDVSVRLLNDSQVTAILTTLVAVTLLLVAVYGVRQRRPLLGGLLIVPVTAAVLWTFGAMRLLGLDFDPVTSTVSALVVGIGIDYVIHLGERFTQDLRERGAIAPAMTATLTHTGGALAGSAVTTVIGFTVLTTASLPPFVRLGVIITLAIGLSLVAALAVGAPLLVLWARWTGVEDAVDPARRGAGRLARPEPARGRGSAAGPHRSAVGPPPTSPPPGPPPPGPAPGPPPPGSLPSGPLPSEAASRVPPPPRPARPRDVPTVPRPPA